MSKKLQIPPEFRGPASRMTESFREKTGSGPHKETELEKDQKNIAFLEHMQEVDSSNPKVKELMDRNLEKARHNYEVDAERGDSRDGTLNAKARAAGENYNEDAVTQMRRGYEKAVSAHSRPGALKDLDAGVSEFVRGAKSLGKTDRKYVTQKQDVKDLNVSPRIGYGKDEYSPAGTGLSTYRGKSSGQKLSHEEIMARLEASPVSDIKEHSGSEKGMEFDG